MKKVIFILLILCSLTLVACDGGSVTEPAGKEEEKVIFSLNVQPNIICNDAENIISSLETLQLSVFKTTYRSPAIYDDSTDIGAHEIVIGKTERPISKKAYELLDTCDVKGGESSYIIYSDGESVAVAFTEDRWQTGYGAKLGMEELSKLFDGSEKIIIPEGKVTSLTFDVLAYQQALDDKKSETDWKNFINAVNNKGGDGEAVAAAVKYFYEKICTDNVIDWFANLYDPTVGGYYFSNDAKNTDGYLPDLESTIQALNFMQSSRILDKYNGVFKDAIPLWMQEQIIRFVKKCQDPENGFFYHPQWTKEMVDAKLSRRARDLDSATKLLKHFGAAPTYDAPNGSKGDGIMWDGTPVENLTGRLLYSDPVFAVSKVAPRASYAAHFESDVTFKAYLDELEEYNNTGYRSFYWIGNHIGSQTSQIKERDKQLKEAGADYSLGDILVEWYTEHQNTETGLWDKGLSYDNTNALLKISGTYTDFGYMFPNVEKAVESCLKMTMTDEHADAVVKVYNVWFAIKNLMVNIETFAQTSEELDIVKSTKQTLLLNAPEAIRLSAEKQLYFKHEDGGIGYVHGENCTVSQGLPVSPAGDGEGDVNATILGMFGTINRIVDSLGLDVDAPAAYTEADRLRYFAILEDNYLETLNDN